MFLETPFYAPVFDSHAHYDDEAFTPDREALLPALKDWGVCGILNCAVNLEQSAADCVALAQKHPFCYAAVGVHPLNMEDAPFSKARLTHWLQQPKVVALGEVGLDYHYTPETRAQQIELFAAQLEVATALGVPVIVHDREAHEDTLTLLKKYRPKGVVHCFSGSAEFAQEVVRLGMYIGLGGATTFKNARKPLEVAARVPADRLLLETDAPYMTPVPYRGKRCVSAYISYTARAVALVRNATPAEILNQTTQNAKALFGI